MTIQHGDPQNSIRLGVLVSGGGTNLQALIDAIGRGELQATIAGVVSNKPDVPALDRAKKAGVPFGVLEPDTFRTREEYDTAIAKIFLKYQVELVILAGFMRILSSAFLRHFPERVLNLHPALLPKDPNANEVLLPDGKISPVFRGWHVVDQVLKSGVKWTGSSVHVVTTDLDRGPVIQQEAVEILPNDTVETLHARIKEVEHRILPRAIGEYAKFLDLTLQE